jgi:preprotein translocase subunit SecE
VRGEVVQQRDPSRPSLPRMVGYVAISVVLTILVFFLIGYLFGRLFL